MVEAHVLRGVFYRHNVFGIFYYTECGAVAPVAHADGADVVIGYIMTVRAETYVEAQLVQSVGKAEGVLFAFFYKVQHQAQSGLLANAGQLGDLVHSFLNEFRWEFQRSIG
jgi:hypothetical protein